MRRHREAWIRRICLLAALLATLPAALPALLTHGEARAADGNAVPAPLGKVRYRIDARSADSWAHYYQLIGLGTVHQGPITAVDWEALTDHCTALEGITGHIWIPLGYSVQRGYKLCYRPGPFSGDEAKVFCARLLMVVAENREAVILCERERDGLRYQELNPYLRGMPKVPGGGDPYFAPGSS